MHFSSLLGGIWTIRYWDGFKPGLKTGVAGTTWVKWLSREHVESSRFVYIHFSSAGLMLPTDCSKYEEEMAMRQCAKYLSDSSSNEHRMSGQGVLLLRFFFGYLVISDSYLDGLSKAFLVSFSVPTWRIIAICQSFSLDILGSFSFYHVAIGAEDWHRLPSASRCTLSAPSASCQQNRTF